MISHTHKFIFTHIPKTGGTSILHLLNDYFDPPVGRPPNTNQRMHNDLVKDLEKCSDDYFKFAFVRNPWDRTVSAYHYVWYSDIMAWWRAGRRSKPWTFKKWLKSRHFSRPRGRKKNRCYRGDQLCWVSSCEGELLADFIGKFENLQEDFKYVCDKLGLPKQELPHKNKSKHKHYTEYYDDETIEIVRKFYKNDIEYFGYEFGE